MKFKKASGLLGFMALTAMASSITLADDFTDDAGWYIGGNLGKTNADIDETRIANNLMGNGFSSGALLRDDTTDRGYKLYGGYQVNRYFALEGGYFNLGEFSFTSTTQPAGTFNSNIKLRGLNVDAVGFLPITEKFSAFGRLGVNYAESKDSFRGTGFVNPLKSRTTERETNPKIGVGLQYAFTEALAVRLEVERYRINDIGSHKGDVGLISAGLVYRFGTSKPPAPVAVVVAPEPVRAPVVVEPPAPVTHFEKYTLSATELFGFNSAAVNLPQKKLEEITTALKTPGSPKQIVITGYTDRLGSDAYNQKLSQERALAVKEYMVNRGIDADRLVAKGEGEADPIVVCTDKNKAALIECLKPNRRVEIDEVKLVRKVTE